MKPAPFYSRLLVAVVILCYFLSGPAARIVRTQSVEEIDPKGWDRAMWGMSRSEVISAMHSARGQWIIDHHCEEPDEPSVRFGSIVTQPRFSQRCMNVASNLSRWGMNSRDFFARQQEAFSVNASFYYDGDGELNEVIVGYSPIFDGRTYNFADVWHDLERKYEVGERLGQGNDFRERWYIGTTTIELSILTFPSAYGPAMGAIKVDYRRRASKR